MAGKNRSKRINRPSLKTLKDGDELIDLGNGQKARYEQVVELARLSLAGIVLDLPGEMSDARKQAEAAEAYRLEMIRTERERIEREGITLKGRRLDHAQNILDAVNISALAIHDLAVSACCTTEIAEAGSYLTAIEDAAILICRRADALADYLGHSPGFGNFKDQLHALSQEEAARMDREEAEREAA